jgi:peptide/nickel transport system substrate-binding protein
MRIRRAALCAATLLALVSAACGDDSGSTSASSSTTAASGSGASTTLAATTTPTPKSGGTLSVGVFSEVTSLDPILGGGTGFTGATEQTALYDVLVRFDDKTGTYQPRTAQSLTPNADFSVWTLKLRTGITFSDGTAYDAAAVKSSVERHTSTKSTSQFKSVIANNVKSIDIVDPLTLTFTLTSPWAGFPVVLASGPGRIVSPTAVAKLGDQLSTAPVGAGAGPFVIDSFRPKEALVVKRNPTYWGGDVKLDSVRFVTLAGSAATYDSLKTNTIQAAYLRDPQVDDQAKQDGFGGIEVPIASAATLQFNAGVVVTCTGGKPDALCTGAADGTKVTTASPAKNIKVRQAIAAAIDPKVINDRAYGGKAVASSSLIPSGFLWDPATPGPVYDPAKAKDLVAQAKAEGWDGKIRLLVQNAGANVPTGDAIETMLRAVGIEIAKDNTKDTQAVVTQVLVNRDYDAVTWGFTLPPDDSLYLTLLQNVTGTYGYSSDAMNAALAKLRVASTAAAKTDALKQISQIWATDVPAVTLAHYPALLAWGSKVHDIAGTNGATLLFDKAWIG